MNTPSPGQRIPVTADGEWSVRVSGPGAERIAVCAVSNRGTIITFESDGRGFWRAAALPSVEEPIEILAYMVDDHQGGFVNACYPIQMGFGEESYSLPAPDQQLAAVILAEVYTRGNARRMKVSNEGFTFGIDAYARARGFKPIEFPGRMTRWSGRAAQDGDSEPPRHRNSGGQVSGSGVIIAPGVIVTNAHVIEDGVAFRLGRTNNMLSPLAIDPLHDLALLEGEIIGTPVWLGEGVLASGYPLMEVLGADLKVTTGNISGLTGGGGDIARFQFTAPIGSGSSGGAIVDENGNLVGVTSASLAHGSMREHGKISENVNFGIRAALVHEMAAAAGCPLPSIAQSAISDRRGVVQRLRNSVVSILVQT